MCSASVAAKNDAAAHVICRDIKGWRRLESVAVEIEEAKKFAKSKLK